MIKKTISIPPDYGSATPFIIVKGVSKFIDFLTNAFGAIERARVPNEDGTIGHAEVMIGDKIIMMFDSKMDWPVTPAFMMLYVNNCDEVHQRSIKAGAIEITPLSTNAWGDRGSRIKDPFGNIWWIQTHVEDPTEDEMFKRMGEEKYIQDMEVSSKTLDSAMKKIQQ